MYIWSMMLVTHHFSAASTSKAEDSRHYWIDIKSHCHVCYLSLIPNFWGLVYSEIFKAIWPRVTLVTHQVFCAFSCIVIPKDIQECSFLTNFKGNILTYQNKRFQWWKSMLNSKYTPLLITSRIFWWKIVISNIFVLGHFWVRFRYFYTNLRFFVIEWNV